MDPSATFEDEILSINPNYDLIFSTHEEKLLNSCHQPLQEQTRRICSPHKMKIISKMNELIGAKPVGELPTQNDWENTKSIEEETIALMRQLGLEQSIDRPPDESRTISTVPTNDDVILMRNGRKKMSIFMGNSYFELKPRSEPSFLTEEDDTSTETSTTTDISDDMNAYAPIPLDTTNETEITEDDSLEKIEVNQRGTRSKKNFNSGGTSDSYKRRSNEVNRELSWRRRSPLPELTRDNKSGRRKSKNYSTESGSGSSNSSWWHSIDSSSDIRDENNWRVSINKSEHIVKKAEELQPKVLKEVAPETSVVSNCRSPLFKPKELFIKKKAMLIQQVLAANQT